MKIHFAESEHWDLLGEEFQKDYQARLKAAHNEMVKLLPFCSKYMNYYVQPREYDLIKETGDAARTVDGELIHLSFSPRLAKKNPNKILGNIKSTVFHEGSHAARFNLGIWHATFMDYCLMEGLATVFERDYGSGNPLWAMYPDNVKEWLEEVRDKGSSIDFGQYLYEHTDGRKWIGYKVGTYIVDEVMKGSGKTVIELMKMECADIFKLLPEQ